VKILSVFSPNNKQFEDRQCYLIMKKTAFSLFTTISVTAQEVVSTQGDSYSNASGNIDFTIGEVVINTGTDGTNDLTQGFHQTNWYFVGLEGHSPSYEATIFPNPTSGFKH